LTSIFHLSAWLVIAQFNKPLIALYYCFVETMSMLYRF